MSAKNTNVFVSPPPAGGPDDELKVEEEEEKDKGEEEDEAEEEEEEVEGSIPAGPAVKFRLCCFTPIKILQHFDESSLVCL